mmetsp:Transcript_62096/g.166032  ORF Transcript_62096/g.166032 Transcript_62096/m.166032 type:complete len:407 (+) Transcript_62096:217-1437(+)
MAHANSQKASRRSLSTSARNQISASSSLGSPERSSSSFTSSAARKSLSLRSRPSKSAQYLPSCSGEMAHAGGSGGSADTAAAIAARDSSSGGSDSGRLTPCLRRHARCMAHANSPSERRSSPSRSDRRQMWSSSACGSSERASSSRASAGPRCPGSSRSALSKSTWYFARCSGEIAQGEAEASSPGAAAARVATMAGRLASSGGSVRGRSWPCRRWSTRCIAQTNSPKVSCMSSSTSAILQISTSSSWGRPDLSRTAFASCGPMTPTPPARPALSSSKRARYAASLAGATIHGDSSLEASTNSEVAAATEARAESSGGTSSGSSAPCRRACTSCMATTNSPKVSFPSWSASARVHTVASSCVGSSEPNSSSRASSAARACRCFSAAPAKARRYSASCSGVATQRLR